MRAMLAFLFCCFYAVNLHATEINSSRLNTLQQDLQKGRTDVLNLFWQEASLQKLPLVESIAGDHENVLVTFIWRAKKEIENVAVISFIGGYDFMQNQMTRLNDTDLWYRTYVVKKDVRTYYFFCENVPFSKLVEMGDNINTFAATWMPDPYNLHSYTFPKDTMLDSMELVVSVLELPDAPKLPWIIPQKDIQAGNLMTHHFSSELLHNTRDIFVYTPPNYQPDGQPYHLVILFDGEAYTQLVPTPTILDNMIAKGAIPPVVAVMISSINQEARNQELPCNPIFIEFLVKELMPWIHKQFNVTSNPAHTLIGGSSYGGLAATYAGMQYPEIFGKVLSQSGAFWWKPDCWKPEKQDKYEWLTHKIAALPKLPLEFYIDVGSLENLDIGGDVPTVVQANRHFRDMLQSKGYLFKYAEFGGGHDYLCWRGTLSDGLLSLFGVKYDEKPDKQSKNRPMKVVLITGAST